MSDLQKRFENLSPAKRMLLERRLQQSIRESSALSNLKQIDAGPAPMAFAQERFWFLNQLDPRNPAYHFAWGKRIRGRLDVPSLERCVNELIQRHEILRTTLIIRDSQRLQVVHPVMDVRLSATDLRKVPEDEREVVARRLLADVYRKPFDLSCDPMWRASLIQLDDHEYWLFLTFHHAAADGWSMSVLENELAALYAAFSAGQPSPLPILPLQFRDFAVWQRNSLDQQQLERQRDYWKRTLANAPTALELPTDFPRPPVPSHRGAYHSISLDRNLSQRLRTLSGSEHVTMYMTFLAAFQLWLARCGGQRDIVVGSPIAGRGRTEFEGLIGCMMNILVLRTDLSGNPTFVDLLVRVREVALGAYANQEMPIEKLIEDLNPPRIPSRTPIFQVLFNYQNAGILAPNWRELAVHHLPFEPGASIYDLTLIVWDDGDVVQLTVEYNAELFMESMIARRWRNFVVLLNAIVENPLRRIEQLPLLVPEERRQLIKDFRSTLVNGRATGFAIDAFAAQAPQTPDAVAVVDNIEHVTYSDLNARANRLAHTLIGQRVGPEQFVAIALERSVEMVVAVLATLKAGAAYLPLDLDQPAVRISQILGNAKPAVVISSATVCDRLPDTVPVFLLDSAITRDRIAHSSCTDPTDSDRLVPRDLRHPAYMIFTSGSTGQPKGVVVEQGALATFLRSQFEVAPFAPGDQHLAVTTLAFDISILELLLPLCHGAQVRVASRDDVRDPQRLANILRLEKITSLQATPSYWDLLLRSDAIGQKKLRILCGGESLSAELASQLSADGRPVWNLYGPTEATVWSSAHRVTADDCRSTAPRVVCIGRPLAGYQIYVLDAFLDLVPVGIPGELYVAGSGLARGYWNQPGLTAERFIADPYASGPGCRMYRTGDRGRWRADGTLEFLGRADQQVKIRGFRIEPGEIEAALENQPCVSQAVILARDDGPSGRHLVAYVVPVDGARLDAQFLRHQLSVRLPEYMLPGAFVVMDRLPLTPNGKLDRQALPPPGRPETTPVAPRNADEARLCELFAELLSLKQVGIHDNFFALGGHSMLAATLVLRIRETSGDVIRLNDLFEAPTPAGLAIRMSGRTVVSPPSARSGPSAAPSDRVAVTGIRDEYPHTTRAANDAVGRDRQLNVPGDPCCEVIRPGAVGIPVACIGDTRPIPFLLEKLPPTVPILHLKLDGAQVWPPRFLTLQEQIEEFLPALERYCPERTVGLLGYSYGAILAHRLAALLHERGWIGLKLMIIEPGIPSRLLPVWTNILTTLRIGRRWLNQNVLSVRTGRQRDTQRSSMLSEPDIPNVNDRWNMMLSHYISNVNRTRFPRLRQHVALVGSDDYHACFTEYWRPAEPWRLDPCILAGAEDHFACFREPFLSQWQTFLEYWYWKTELSGADDPLPVAENGRVR